MIIKFSNNYIFGTDIFYFGICTMICSLAVESIVREPVSPGIPDGQCHFRDGKEDLAFKIIRPIFEEISLFHKKITRHT